MSLFKTRSVTVKTPAGTFTNGKWVAGTPTNSRTVNCTIQPMKSKELELLPEGRRELESYKMYCSNKLNTITDNGNNPDIVTFNSADYEIFSRSDWQNKVLNHYKYIIQKVVTK
jgi:hypothetical protein